MKPPNTMTAAEYRALREKGAKRTKYGNKPTTHRGEKFDSQLELAVYLALCAKYGARNVIRQVSIPVGGLRVRLDFMVLGTTGPWISGFFADAKGMLTATAKAKYNHLRDKHGIEVVLIKSASEV